MIYYSLLINVTPAVSRGDANVHVNLENCVFLLKRNSIFSI